MSEEWIVGWHAVKIAFKIHPETIQKLCLKKAAKGPNVSLVTDYASGRKIPIEYFDIQHFDSLFPEVQHQGVAILSEKKAEYTEATVFQYIEQHPTLTLLLLEEVQDPHNLGAIWRTAAALGVDVFMATNHNTAPASPIVHKTAQGAASVLPLIRIGNLAQFLTRLKELQVWIVGCAGEGKSTIAECVLPARTCFILGQEGSGLNALTQKHCDDLVSIPLSNKGIDSLNVSVAAGIVLYERQRRISSSPFCKGSGSVAAEGFS